MESNRHSDALIVGISILVGLALLGFFVSRSDISIRRTERTVTVKGLSERELPADIAILPVTFNEAGNDLGALYASVAEKTNLIVEFLTNSGFSQDEISISAPTITDKLAQGFAVENVSFRYSAKSTVTVYTGNVGLVRETMKRLVELGSKGIAITSEDYSARTEFLFTGLNEIKPGMIEEATKNAREVAEKFARDSKSRLGKIKTASQGQFSISDRDSNTPYIKKVRVVSTVEYSLID